MADISLILTNHMSMHVLVFLAVKLNDDPPSISGALHFGHGSVRTNTFLFS